MKQIIIVAGPNGAGKTSFVTQYFPFGIEGFSFVNADEIARTFSETNLSQFAIDVRAGRAMLDRIESLLDSNQEFILETTLASLTYAQKIPKWQERGYEVHLLYLMLADVEHALQRVQRRVAAGGHSIPEEVVRTRYAKSLRYLEKMYKPIVDEWYVWESLEGDFVLREAWDD